MKHNYDQNYSETFANVRVSLDMKLRLKEYAESLTDPITGFVSMRSVIDKFLKGDRNFIENYLNWLATNYNV